MCGDSGREGRHAGGETATAGADRGLGPARLYAASPAQEAYELLRPMVLFGRTPRRAPARPACPSARCAARPTASTPAGWPASSSRRRRPPPTAARCRRRSARPSSTSRPRTRRCAPVRSPPSADAASGARSTATRSSGCSPVAPPERCAAALPTLPRHRRPGRAPAGHRAALPGGLTVTAIAGYLATKRDRVYQVLRRWAADQFAGSPTSRAPQHPARKVDLKALAAIRRLQANPGIGGFRASAALEQQGIDLSPRTCRRLLARHREPVPPPTCG